MALAVAPLTPLTFLMSRAKMTIVALGLGALFDAQAPQRYWEGEGTGETCD